MLLTPSRSQTYCVVTIHRSLQGHDLDIVCPNIESTVFLQEGKQGEGQWGLPTDSTISFKGLSRKVQYFRSQSLVIELLNLCKTSWEIQFLAGHLTTPLPPKSQLYYKEKGERMNSGQTAIFSIIEEIELGYTLK